jgi:hypothetical protein
VIASGTLEQQAKQIQGKVVDLLVNERVSANQIPVLVPSTGHRNYYDMLERMALPPGCGWAVERSPEATEVGLETERRFKGLESDVVLWWLAGEVVGLSSDVRYVTLSQAKALLVLIGDAAACQSLLDVGE